MKSIANQYRDLKEGRMSQANFMRNLRMSMPQYITNVTSFNDAVRILKNKAILTENVNESDPSREAELGGVENDFKELLAKGYSYYEALELISQNTGMDADELEAMFPQDAVDIEGHEGEDDELAAMVAKAEEEEFGPEKYKFQDFPGGISEAEEFFPRSPIKMAELIAQIHGEELKSLSGKDRQKLALSKAYEEIYYSDHPKANVIAKNLVWGYADEDWPMDYISALDDILGRDNLSEAKKKKEAKTELHPNQIHPQELRMGIKVELEHTDDLDKAKKIALDHLKENPFYYTALKLSGIESPSAPKVKAPAEKKAKKKKEAVELVDKVNQMVKVKDTKKKLNEAGGEFMFSGTLNNVEAEELRKIIPGVEIEEEELEDTYKTVISHPTYNEKSLRHAVKQAMGQLPPVGDKKDLGASFDKFKSQLEEIVREVMAEMQSDDQEIDNMAMAMDETFDGRDNLDAETEK